MPNPPRPCCATRARPSGQAPEGQHRLAECPHRPVSQVPNQRRTAGHGLGAHAGRPYIEERATNTDPSRMVLSDSYADRDPLAPAIGFGRRGGVPVAPSRSLDAPGPNWLRSAQSVQAGRDRLNSILDITMRQASSGVGDPGIGFGRRGQGRDNWVRSARDPAGRAGDSSRIIKEPARAAHAGAQPYHRKSGPSRSAKPWEVDRVAAPRRGRGWA